MALILDTDHLSEFERGSPAGERLRDRLVLAVDQVATTVISLEEQLRGWLAQIHRLNDNVAAQIPPYNQLQRRAEFFAKWKVLPWEAESARLFQQLRNRGVRIGAMDLKIACIAIVNDSMLLTRNTGDF